VFLFDFQGVSQTSKMLTGEDLSQFSGKVECEVPNRHLYEFIGTLKIESLP
jgi:phospholipid-transporting ATPase